MNCCDTYGNCNQGRECPARTGKVLPHQAAHAKRMESHEYATEAGNVWFAEPEPVEFTCWEKISFYACIGAGCVVTTAILAGASGWVYQTFFN